MANHEAKKRAGFFSAAEQQLLVELHEEYKEITTKKGNTSAINKARVVAWQKITERINASNLGGERRTWQQVKTKYKNISHSATKKMSQATATGGEPPPEDLKPPEALAPTVPLTPTVALALSTNKGRPQVEGIEGGISTEIIPPGAREKYVKVKGDEIHLADPTATSVNGTLDPCFDGPIISMAVDEATRSVDTDMSEDIRTIYKRKLLLSVEREKLDIKHKRLLIKKTELEIRKLEEENSGGMTITSDYMKYESP